MVMWLAWVIWEEFFLKKILQKAAQRPTKVNIFPYKQLSGRNGDHEWLKMTNAFIVSDLVWKIQKSPTENSEGSFKESAIRNWIVKSKEQHVKSNIQMIPKTVLIS